MTLLNPTLALKRIVVTKSGYTVFDASFHSGVNIIRGHNSSGKTTILDFIAYSLGAEYIPWKQEALLCDFSIAEILLNGRPTTIKRPVNDRPMNPMYIFWGSFEEAINAPMAKWELYSFRRTETRLSFTQGLLLAADLPEAQGDGASNLTMHQLLRVLYADQPSLHSPIFRNDAFDSALNRETVGGYLVGVYDDKLYSAQLEKRTLEKNLQQLDAELKSIFTVIARSSQNASIELLGQDILNREHEHRLLLEELSRLRSDRTMQPQKKSVKGELLLREQLNAAAKSLNTTLDHIANLEFEIADSQQFIEELRVRLKSLDESKATREYFGKLSFSFCPCCLSEIPPLKDEGDECALCKTPINTAIADSQLLRMKNELRIQLEESLSLVSMRENELQKHRNSLPHLKQELRLLERRYSESTETWSSELETAIEATARKVGALEQEIKGLYENQRLASTIRDIQESRNAVRNRIVDLDNIIESLIYSQEYRKQEVNYLIASTLARLLREDLPRQAEFEHADDVQFSFADNSISVEGSYKFSESSTVVLRHLFHIALLSASTKIPQMRLPRFMILDGIEDGGMELERSHRLQEIIVNECNSFDCDYQLIFATSQIAPSLDDSALVVSRQFSEERRSLEIL